LEAKAGNEDPAGREGGRGDPASLAAEATNQTPAPFCYALPLPSQLPHPHSVTVVSPFHSLCFFIWTKKKGVNGENGDANGAGLLS
jgi:hypothetical protein